VPQVIFTDPEVAAVGLTEADARGRRINARAVDYDIGRVAGAGLYADGYKGKARVVVDQEHGILIGMTLVGPSVGELIQQQLCRRANCHRKIEAQGCIW
jgi:dihydrolipoamide dehydrogenase